MNSALINLWGHQFSDVEDVILQKLDSIVSDNTEIDEITTKWWESYSFIMNLEIEKKG